MVSSIYAYTLYSTDLRLAKQFSYLLHERGCRSELTWPPHGGVFNHECACISSVPWNSRPSFRNLVQGVGQKLKVVDLGRWAT